MATASDQGHQWQAAMGFVTGALVGEALALEQPTWGPHGAAGLTFAEDLLSGRALPIGLAPVHAPAVAVHFAGTGSPLLVDPTTLSLIAFAAELLSSSGAPHTGDPTLRSVLDGFEDAPGFVEAVDSAPTLELKILSGALYGLVGGIGAIPMRLVADATGSDGRASRRYLSRLVDRLLGIKREPWFDPRVYRAPREVLPGIWVSNVHAVKRFAADKPDSVIISLCEPEGRLEGHLRQMTAHIDDTPSPRANPRLADVLDDVLSEVAAAEADNRPVLIHCRHGASRTGLVLRLLLQTRLQLSPEDALTEAQCLWPQTSTWNKAWTRELERRAGESTAVVDVH